MSRFVDLSHIIEHGLPTYKGLPAPVICDYLSRHASRRLYAEGTEFQIGRIDMVANTGTYLDSPFHRYENGDDLSQLRLEQVATLEGIVVRQPYEHGLPVDVDALKGLPLRGRAVLIHTGWARHWRTPQYFEHHPFVTEAAASLLASSNAALVGIDSHNIDDTRTRTRPVHTVLLGAGIPICEHLCNLDALPDDGFHFYAVPPKVRAFGTFPVRAFGVIR